MKSSSSLPFSTSTFPLSSLPLQPLVVPAANKSFIDDYTETYKIKLPLHNEVFFIIMIAISISTFPLSSVPQPLVVRVANETFNHPGLKHYRIKHHLHNEMFFIIIIAILNQYIPIIVIATTTTGRPSSERNFRSWGSLIFSFPQR